MATSRLTPEESPSRRRAAAATVALRAAAVAPLGALGGTAALLASAPDLRMDAVPPRTCCPGARERAWRRR